MSQVTFYLMSQPDDADASAVERLACQLAADGWSAGHLYLLCEDEAQAPASGRAVVAVAARSLRAAPVAGGERSGPGGIGHQPPRRRYACLINLARQTPLFAGHFAQVVDFVPTDETQKASPRALQALSPGGPYPRDEGSARPCRTGSGAALTVPPSIHDESTPDSIHPEYGETMEKTFNHNAIEQALYQHWEAQGYFKPHGDTSKDSFCIMIPPPNVTGSLHMGHAFQQTLMDT